MPRKTIPQGTIDKIMSCPDEMNHAEIAALCVVSRTTVLNYRGPSPHPSWCTIIDGRGSNSLRKLTRDEVEYIRRRKAVLTLVELARLYGISKATISAVRQGRTYREWL
jgi:hypothetical protein